MLHIQLLCNSLRSSLSLSISLTPAVASKADATECIKLAPNFIKGYYRMVQAQVELGDFDGATNTAKAGLELDSDNSELQKQLRSIRTKKAAAAAMAKNQQMGRPVNQGEAKELLELQDQMQATRREMNEVQQYLAGCEREQRMAELSKENIGEVRRGLPGAKVLGAIDVRR